MLVISKGADAGIRGFFIVKAGAGVKGSVCFEGSIGNGGGYGNIL